jgi:hypothetical protein
MVSEYRGGPRSGAEIVVFSCNAFWGIACRTLTDVQGHYTIESPSMEPTALGVWKAGYQTAWKKLVSAQDSIASFVVHPSVGVSVFGSTIKGTVSGDEFMGGDDVLFGGLCAHIPCDVMQFDNFIGAPRQAEVRLRWANSTHQLALYKFDGDPDIILDRDQPALRYCCASEVVATISIGGYFDAIAVAFERAASGPPAPSDSQQFELTVRPIP